MTNKHKYSIQYFTALFIFELEKHSMLIIIKQFLGWTAK